MATPQMRKDLRSVIAGLAVLGVIGFVVFIAVNAQTGLPFAATTTVTAEIADVHTLAVNDQVRQDGKRIGRVSAISYQNGHAVVTMQISGHRAVYKNASAVIADQSALAMKFVAFDPGTPRAGALGNGHIPLTQTEGSADLQQLLGVFDPKTRAAATAALRQVGGGLSGHSQDLHDFVGNAPSLLKDLATTTKALAAPDTNLPALLRSADDLSARFRGREGQIQALVQQSDTTLRAIAVDGGRPLQQILAASPATLSNTRLALNSLDAPLANLQAAMSVGMPGARALGSSTPDVRGFLRESVPVLGKVPAVAQQAQPAVVDLTTTFQDAQPLAPLVASALSSLATPLDVLAPYGPEIAQFFVRGHSFVSEGPAPGKRWARLSFNVEASTVTGGLFTAANYPRDPYPAPGVATGERATSGLPSGLIPNLKGGH